MKPQTETGECLNRDTEKLEVQHIWRLHLTRNAIMLSGDEKNPPELWERENAACFYMFDYFDKMVCRRVTAEEQDHRFCFGLNQPPDEIPPTASYYLTLLSLCGENSSPDPFFYRSDSPEASGRPLPFLSIILVTITSVGLENETNSSRGQRPPKESEVKDFLISCARELRKTAERTRDKFQEAEMKCRVFQCVNSGNFCVAVRTDRPELSYHIAMNIRQATLNAGRHYHFPELSCGTFSLTGMEYPNNLEPENALSDGLAAKIQADVVMRLSLPDRESVHEMYSASKGGEENGQREIRTLFGRYDMTMTMKMKAFRRVYPWICAAKFDHKIIAGEARKQEKMAEPDPLLRLLMERLEKNQVQAVNERILIDADRANSGEDAEQPVGKRLIDADRANSGGDAEQSAQKLTRGRQKLVRMENLTIRSMMSSLLEQADCMGENWEDYCHYLHLLRDLWKNYSSLRYQEDSFINGHMFLAQIWLALSAVENYICGNPKNCNAPDGKDFFLDKKAYEDLMVFLRKAIQSISHFQKLMQSINQQSLMAPNYEVQMHTDLEKFMVAYTEFARRFLGWHYRTPDRDAQSDDKQRILPLFMMDVLHGDSISADALFLLPYWRRKRDGLCQSNPRKERLLLSIVMPDIETFGDLYGTLPVICHELSHNFRVMDRETRNDALCRFVMDKAADYAARMWISRVCEQTDYVSFGHIQRWIGDAIAQCLYEAYTQWFGKEVQAKSNIGALNSNMHAFLSQYFFVDADATRAGRQNPDVSAGEVRGLLEQLCVLYQSFQSLDDAAWYPEFLECWQGLEEMRKLEKADNSALSERNGDILFHAEERGKKRRTLYLNLREPLRVTANKMLEDIVNCQQRLLLTAGERLKEHVRRFYTDANSILPLLKAVPEAFKGPETFTYAPYSDETDYWIFSAKNRIDSAYRHCENLPSKIIPAEEREDKRLNQEIQDALDVHKKNLLYATDEACRTIKDASHLYKMLLTYCNDRDDVFDPYHIERNGLLLFIKGRLRFGIWPTPEKIPGLSHAPRAEREDASKDLERFRSLYPTRSYTSAQLQFLYGSAQMQELLAPLCLDMDDPTLFLQALSNGLQIQGRVPEMLVQDSVTIYREIFADLGMCLALGLNRFGYLMVMSHSKTICRDVVKPNRSASLLERMNIVCLTLDACEKTPDSDGRILTESVKCYEKRMRGHFKKALTGEAFRELEARSFFQRLQRAIENPDEGEHIEACPINLVPENWVSMRGATERRGSELWRQKRQNRCRELSKDLQRLWMTVFFSAYIRLNADLTKRNIWDFHPRIVEHFVDLYSRMRTLWERPEQARYNSHVLSKIGAAYREGRVEPFLRKASENPADSVNASLKDTLSFVLFYYYQNWNVYSDLQGFEKRFQTETGKNRKKDEQERSEWLNKWIDNLMGGDFPWSETK